jgi:hypothetical protein
MDFSFPPAAEKVGLVDFTPLSQDLFALQQIQNKHGIDLGTFTDADFQGAVHKLSWEWASFPAPDGMSRYSFKGKKQPAKSYPKLWDVYAAARAGQLPVMGYDSYHWNETYANALRDLQFEYEVKATGDFDDETYQALFDGKFGTAGPDQERPEPEPTAAEPAPDNLGVASDAEMYPTVQDMPYIKVSRTDAWGYDNGMEAVSVQVFAADGTQVDIIQAFSGLRRTQGAFQDASKQLRRGSLAPTPQGLYTIGEHVVADGPVPGKVRNINDVWMHLNPVTNVGSRAAIGIHTAPSGGTAGCIGLFSKQDAHRLSQLVKDMQIGYVLVDWGI